LEVQNLGLGSEGERFEAEETEDFEEMLGEAHQYQTNN